MYHCKIKRGFRMNICCLYKKAATPPSTDTQMQHPSGFHGKQDLQRAKTRRWKTTLSMTRLTKYPLPLILNQLISSCKTNSYYAFKNY